MLPLAGASGAAPAASMRSRRSPSTLSLFSDLRSIFAAVKQRFPEQGEALGQLWFTKIFRIHLAPQHSASVCWLEVVAAQAFDAAAATLGIATTATDRDVLVAAFFQMELWPDVVRLVGDFQQRGLRLAFLANLSEAMLRSNMRRAGIERFFQAALSTDRARAFKPAPEAYQLGVEEFGLKKEEVAFAAFAAWDAAGASWFGYPTAWVNRLGQQARAPNSG